MKTAKKIAAVAAALTMTVSLGGCLAEESVLPGADAGQQEEEVLPPETEQETEGGETSSEEPKTEPPVETPVTPAVRTVTYVMVTGDGVNIRTGAGSGYSSLGAAEKNTLYAADGLQNGWYKTRYRNKTVYISAKYCKEVSFEAAGEAIERVISTGAKLLGTPYVYGAVRLHDGSGNLYKGFTVSAFDCSSLMQYMFYYGASALLQVNTRTQVYQGTTVKRSQLQRGDLIFFTNASRYNKTGVERIGHVAIYLGDNYILHTASDYAKIEQISSQRWSYYIQAQRIL